jgi:hypothetical protein
MQLGSLASELDPRQQGAVAGSGGAEQRAVADDQVVYAENSLQIFWRYLGGHLRPVCPFMEPHEHFHVAAQTLQGGCRQHRLGRAASAHVQIYAGSG